MTLPSRPVATQISAFVSSETKEQIDRYTRSTGVKKNHLVEEALRHHLQALRELPADIVVHPRIVVTLETGRALMKQRAAKPTAKLRALMARDDD
jgi:hypothetical protein